MDATRAYVCDRPNAWMQNKSGTRRGLRTYCASTFTNVSYETFYYVCNTNASRTICNQSISKDYSSKVLQEMFLMCMSSKVPEQVAPISYTIEKSNPKSKFANRNLGQCWSA